MPALDPTLEGAARSTLERMQRDLQTLHGKMIQAAKRRDETLRRQFIARARARLPRRPRAGAHDRLRLVPEPVRPGARRSARRGAAPRPRASLDCHHLNDRSRAEVRLADRERQAAVGFASSAFWRKRWVRLAGARGWPSRPCSCCSSPRYYYVRFAHLIDARLHGERDTVFPRVLARPLELRRGQSLTDRQLIDRLNDLGYAQRDQGREAGRVRDRQRRGRDHAARRRTARADRARRLSAAGRAARRRGKTPPRRTPPRAGRSRAAARARIDRPSERLVARRAGAHVARAAANARSGGRSRWRRFPTAMTAGGAGDRGSPLLRASRRRSDRHRRRA